jgi:Rrf2 family protein
MNISVRCEYACRAVLELALQDAHAPVTVETIAAKRGIPEKFLVQILIQLKRAGLVGSVRGSRGGYLLARSPQDITLLEILEAVDGRIFDPLPIASRLASEVAPVWRKVAEEIAAVLEKPTVWEMLNTDSKSAMYYI